MPKKTNAELNRELSEITEEWADRGRAIKSHGLELEVLHQQAERDAKELEAKSTEIFRLQNELADAALALKLTAKLNSAQHEKVRAGSRTIHTHWRYAAPSDADEPGGSWTTVEKGKP